MRYRKHTFELCEESDANRLFDVIKLLDLAAACDIPQIQASVLRVARHALEPILAELQERDLHAFNAEGKKGI